MPDLALY